LDTIARRAGITAPELVAANCLETISLLRVGQSIAVPQRPLSSSDIQRTDAPIIALINGDLWAWSASAPQFQQITQWGYNERPVISPDGTRVAYNSWAQVTIEAIGRGVPVTGIIPSNTWIWNLASGEALRIADQPENVIFTAEGSQDNAIMRSTPAWSPDGTRLGWTEIVLPDYTRQLVTYDFESHKASIIVPNLPLPYVDAGNFAIADIQWGGPGIALQNIAFNPAGQTFEQVIWVYDPAGTLISSTLVSSGDQARVVAFVWAAYDDKDYLALLYQDGSWSLLDPVLTTIQPAPAPPELYSLTSADNSAAPTISSVYHDPVFSLGWSLIAPDRSRIQPINFGGYPSKITIEPSGQGVAYMSDTIYIWRDGTVSAVPNTGALSESRSTSQPGLAWGPTGWRIRTDRPAPSAPAACEQTPRLVIGGLARLSTDDLKALHLAPDINSGTAGDIPPESILTVLNGPECAAVYNWWQVNYNGVIGWIPENEGSIYWLEPYTPVTCPLAPQLNLNASAMVALGLPNVLRSAPGLGDDSAITGQIPGGGYVLVIDGPQCADGYNWWLVNYGGLTGWTAEGETNEYWVVPLICPNSPPSRFVPTMQGIVLPGEPNVLRSQPGTTSDSIILGEIAPGEIFTVVTGPQCGNDGRLWWQILYENRLSWTPEGDGDTYWLEPWQG
jgi:hypothetical protein